MDDYFDRDHVVAAKQSDMEILRKAAGEHVHITNARQLLSLTHVSTLLPEKPSIVRVFAKESVSEAFKAMIEHHILSVPVFDREKKTYIGLIDMVDIVHHALAVLGEKELRDTNVELCTRAEFIKSTCEKLTDKSKRNPYFPVDGKAPLLAAISLMIRWKAHRIPILSNQGELVTLLTESQVLRFLHENISFFPAAAKSLKDLSLGQGQVYGLAAERTAIDAFKLIRDKNVSGIAVWDNDREQNILGNVSVSDLKIVGDTGRLFIHLLEPLHKFLELIPPNPEIPGPICTSLNSTLEEVIAKLVITRVHRVYVVTQEGKLWNVISLHDALSLLVKPFM